MLRKVGLWLWDWRVVALFLVAGFAIAALLVLVGLDPEPRCGQIVGEPEGVVDCRDPR